jgi:hypothetical protein
MPKWPNRFWSTPSDQFDDGTALSIGEDVGDATGRRVDVARLMDLLNYGSAFCPIVGARDMARTGAGKLPFTEFVGYHRATEIKEGGGITFGVAGTWDIRVKATGGFYSYPYVGTSAYMDTYLEIDVHEPDGTVFSKESAYFPDNFFNTSIVVAGGVTYQKSTCSFSASVQVPEAGYYVTAWINGGHGSRPYLGGPQWTRMTAQNISSEFITGAATGAEPSTNIGNENP